jgi:hypothetical protein
VDGLFSKGAFMNLLKVLRATLICLTVGLVFLPSSFVSSAKRAAFGGGELPREVDVRGVDGVPKGGTMRVPTEKEVKALAEAASDPKSAAALAQSRAINALQAKVGAPLQVYANALTGTPRHMLSHAGYLTAPRMAHPEAVARLFSHSPVRSASSKRKTSLQYHRNTRATASGCAQRGAVR